MNQWLENQSDPIDLTVVYAYTLVQDTACSLKAADFGQAKQEAADELTRWLNFLPQPRPVQAGAEAVVSGDSSGRS